MRGGPVIRGAGAALAAAACLALAPALAAASVGDFAMAVQPDGKVVVAGGSGRVGGNASGREFGAVVRYQADGRLDPGFGGGDGVLLARDLAPFTALDLDAKGRILLASPTGQLSRLLPDGRFDANFGVAGKAPAGTTSAYFPTSVRALGNGSILLGGMTGYLADPGEHLYGRLYMYSPDGLHSRWVGSMTSGDGRPGEPKTYLNDFVVGPGGMVIGAGTSAPREAGARGQAALAQLLPGPNDGVYPTGPNPSFGGGAGLVSSAFAPFSPASEAANALSWDRGKLLLAGQAGEKLLLARYRSDGTLDAGFGRGGARLTGFHRAASSANAVAVQRGAIFAAGGSGYGCGAAGCTSLLLARYRPSGRLDRRFGAGGIVSPRVDSATYGKPAGEVAYGVAGRGKGGVIVGGLVTGPGSSRFFLRRYLPDGEPDPGFGNGGRVTTLPILAGTAAPGAGHRSR